MHVLNFLDVVVAVLLGNTIFSVVGFIFLEMLDDDEE
jgi:hypothetical protein